MDVCIYCVFLFVLIDVVPEGVPEPDVRATEADPEEPKLELHCNESIDNGKSTGILT